MPLTLSAALASGTRHPHSTTPVVAATVPARGRLTKVGLGSVVVMEPYSLPSGAAVHEPAEKSTSRESDGVVGSSTAEDGDAGVGAAADDVGEPGAGAVDLAWAGGAAELVDELDDLAEGAGAEGFSLGEQAAAGVDRRRPVGGERLLLTSGLTEPKLLPRQQLSGGV